MDDIREAQQNYDIVQNVIKLVYNSDEKVTIAKEMRPFVDKLDEFFIDGSILYLQVFEGHIQMILPPSLRDKVLMLLHQNPTGGHLGVNRNVARFEQQFYWPGMQRIISHSIRSCLTCEKFKPSKENTMARLQPINTQRVLELLEIDFVGPLTTTNQGHKYIVTVIDHFSKYAVAYATATQDTKAVIDCLKQYFSQFGIPDRILSDQGCAFISKPFLEFLNLWGIVKATSTSYHPETQGLIERFNGTIMQILKRYVYETPDTWNENLPLATFAYNTSIQRINNVTPHEVMFGRKVNTTLSSLNGNYNEITPIEHVLKVRRDMERINRVIINNQEIAREEEKEKYDIKTAGEVFSTGDYVLLYNPAVKMGESKKFAPCYQGPFRIEGKVGTVNFHIKPIDTKFKEQTVHQNRLKRFYPPSERTSKKNLVQKLKGSEDKEVSSDSDDGDMIMIRQTIQTKNIITSTQEMHYRNDTIVNKETESATRLVLPVATDTTTQILLLTTSRDGSTSTEPPMNTIRTPQADEERLWLTVPLPSSSNSAESITSRSDQQNSDLNGQTMYLSPEDTQLSAENKMDDSSNNICQEDENSLEDDANDETFQPGQDITPLTRRIQPARIRRKLARYPAKEYNIAGISFTGNNQ